MLSMLNSTADGPGTLFDGIADSLTLSGHDFLIKQVPPGELTITTGLRRGGNS